MSAHALATTAQFAAPAASDAELARSGIVARSRRVALDFVALADVLACFSGGLVGASAVVFRGDSAIAWPSVVQICLITSLFCYLCLRHFGFYDIARITALPVRPLAIVAALSIALICTFGLGLPHGARVDHLRTWYGVWLVSAFVLLTASRLLARPLLSGLAARGDFDIRLAIYGSGALAERIADNLFRPGSMTRLAGVFDDRTAERRPGAADIHGGIDDLIALGRSGGVDQIVIALPQSADKRSAEIARRLEQLPVSLHVITHLAGDLVDPGTRHRVSAIGPVGLLDIKTKPLADWGRHVKAVEDTVIGTLALIAALPAMAMIALAIKLDSNGPVFFRQQRHGLNRRIISVLKFRTMTVMENGTEVRQASAGDTRITRVGAFLRKSSLDELPQLFNVLCGEMSLIGPRPHALVHDDQYGDMLERYANRHQVKPGMTGLAQVNGFRGPTETPDKMQSRVSYDLAYIDRWSLWLDLHILAKTLVVGFRHRNAV